MLEQHGFEQVEVEERPASTTTTDSSLRCTGKTKSGLQCQAKASSSGYCNIHDPAKIAERSLRMREQEAELQAQKKAYIEKTQALNRIIDAIQATCKAKGWSCKTHHFDGDTGVYATLNVSYSLDLGVEVLASIDIEYHPGELALFVNQNPFSVSDHGLSNLYQSILRDLGTRFGKLTPSRSSPYMLGPTKPDDAFQKVELILKNFHRAAKQLETRHDRRGAITIRDEYDVQDVLRSFLHLSFEDIRPEDYVPLYAGARSRIDFLLFEEEIVVEAKMTRENLRDREVGEQLIIDIQRYQAHPRCSTLFCFVYDPGSYLGNPKSLINDLNGKHGEINVKLIIYRP